MPIYSRKFYHYHTKIARSSCPIPKKILYAYKASPQAKAYVAKPNAPKNRAVQQLHDSKIFMPYFTSGTSRPC